MAILRPNALPPGDIFPEDAALPVDDNVNVKRWTPAQIVATGRPLADQAEAEAGTNPTKAMTPLTTKQQIEAIGPTLFATVAQGALADSAVQPGDLAAVASTGDYSDLSGTPSLGTAAAASTSDFAPAAAGLPTGGTIGQFLRKASGTNFDASWQDLPGGGDMLKSVYDPNNIEADAFDSLNTAFDPSGSILTSTNVQGAIGEAASQIGWEFIDLVNPSGQAVIDLINLAPFSIVCLVGWLRPATDAVRLFGQSSTNNGVSFDGGASDYVYSFRYAQAGSALSQGNGAASAINMSPGVQIGNTAPEYIAFELELKHFNKAAYMAFTEKAHWLSATSTFQDCVYNRGHRANAVARNAFRLAFDSGLIATGQVLAVGKRG
jgi:hypothetical protein